jgi:hypothetical protein
MRSVTRFWRATLLPARTYAQRRGDTQEVFITIRYVGRFETMPRDDRGKRLATLLQELARQALAGLANADR